MSVIIEMNTVKPVKMSKKYFSTSDYQTAFLIEIYEGERAMIKDNRLLGKFELHGIPKALRGEAEVTVTFDIDADGILNASAVNEESGNANQITITKDKGRLSASEIDRLIQEAEKYKADDEAEKKRVKARNDLDLCVYRLLKNLNRASPQQQKEIQSKCDAVTEWLSDNENAGKDEFERKQRELESMAEWPIF